MPRLRSTDLKDDPPPPHLIRKPSWSVIFALHKHMSKQTIHACWNNLPQHFFFLLFLGVACWSSIMKLYRKSDRGGESDRKNVKRKVTFRTAIHHLLQLRLQTLGCAHFSREEWVGGEQERCSGGGCRRVCIIKINWPDERGALCFAVEPVIYLVMSPMSVCLHVCVDVWNFTPLGDPTVRPLGSEEDGYDC